LTLRILIQKFGGTSVASPERRAEVLRRIEEAVHDGYRPVVVVSAPGRYPDPYATDTLLSLVRKENLTLPRREEDLLVACGEVVGVCLMVATLRQASIPAVGLTGGQAGIITDDNFGDATIQRIDTNGLLGHLKAGRIPVVAGFQGVTGKGDITTLGRGGSDVTAAALGAALKVEVVEIFTDVDGVKTADPRIVPQARTLQVSTYDEVAQMAHYGAKVIHPRAVEIAMQYSLPLRIKATAGGGPGTLVTYAPEAAGPRAAFARSSPVTAVTQVSGLVQVEVATPGESRGVRMYQALADAGVSVDLINASPGLHRFCVDARRTEQAREVLTGLGLEARLREDVAKVSVVGAGMRGRPGVMATVVTALDSAGVEVLQSADSHVTISCLVPQDQMEAAVKSLHQAFCLEES
jgi:aspartate kinase